MKGALVDSFLGAATVASALEDAGEEVALVCHEELPDGEPAPKDGPAYGPLPSAVLVAQLRRGSRVARWAGEDRTLDGVEATVTKLPWGGGIFGPAFEKWRGQVLLTSGSSRVIVSELVAGDEASARAEAEAARQALIAFTALEKDPSDERPTATQPAAPRFALRFEAGALVLRDHAGPGPHASGGGFRVLAFVLALFAGGSALALVGRVRDGAGATVLAGWGVLTAVLVLGVVAMAEIARFGGKYGAKSAPLAWFASDRVVIEPWVSREGAVDLTPEGRLGAGLPTAEISSVGARPAEQGFSVVLDGPHGPVAAVTTNDQAEAEALSGLVERAIAAAASPKRRPSARAQAA